MSLPDNDSRYGNAGAENNNGGTAPRLRPQQRPGMADNVRPLQVKSEARPASGDVNPATSPYAPHPQNTPPSQSTPGPRQSPRPQQPPHYTAPQSEQPQPQPRPVQSAQRPQTAQSQPQNSYYARHAAPVRDSGNGSGGNGSNGSNRPPRDYNEMSKTASKRKKPVLWIVLAAVLLLIVGALAVFLLRTQQQAKEAEEQAMQAQLDMEQMQLQADYDDLNQEFSMLENQRNVIMDDSVKRDLMEKYETARLQVEKLQQELKQNKQRSAAEIKKLKDEISTLRALLRHYVEEINRLNKENEQLRTENTEIKAENQSLQSRVQETSRQNERLTERMTLAEKLNVTGSSLTPLNKKGKKEKKVKKAVQLMFHCTIPQNNSTPVGQKTIYMRLISPTGQLLGSGGSFSFEGASVVCTAKKVIEYTGEETQLTIYYDVASPLTPGPYTVELFADNFRILSRSFELN